MTDESDDEIWYQDGFYDGIRVAIDTLKEHYIEREAEWLDFVINELSELTK